MMRILDCIVGYADPLMDLTGVNPILKSWSSKCNEVDLEYRIDQIRSHSVGCIITGLRTPSYN
jgi:hypothetical protein